MHGAYNVKKIALFEISIEMLWERLLSWLSAYSTCSATGLVYRGINKLLV